MITLDEQISYIEREIAYLEGDLNDDRSSDIETLSSVKESLLSLEKGKITRVEVIDHYNENHLGRVFLHYKEDSKVDYELQDEGRALKIFISKKSS